MSIKQKKFFKILELLKIWIKLIISKVCFLKIIHINNYLIFNFFFNNFDQFFLKNKDLSSINKEAYLINWGPVIDQNFFEQYKKFLLTSFNHKESLFFICRSGSRSFMAAKFAIELGFKNSFNIYEGFHNENDQNWKKNLPVKLFKHH